MLFRLRNNLQIWEESLFAKPKKKPLEVFSHVIAFSNFFDFRKCLSHDKPSLVNCRHQNFESRSYLGKKRRKERRRKAKQNAMKVDGCFSFCPLRVRHNFSKNVQAIQKLGTFKSQETLNLPLCCSLKISHWQQLFPIRSSNGEWVG